jgi:hypothetical protein
MVTEVVVMTEVPIVLNIGERWALATFKSLMVANTT